MLQSIVPQRAQAFNVLPYSGPVPSELPAVKKMYSGYPGRGNGFQVFGNSILIYIAVYEMEPGLRIIIFVRMGELLLRNPLTCRQTDRREQEETECSDPPHSHKLELAPPMRTCEAFLEAIVLVGKNGSDKLGAIYHIQFVILNLHPHFCHSLGNDVIKLLLCDQIQTI